MTCYELRDQRQQTAKPMASQERITVCENDS